MKTIQIDEDVYKALENRVSSFGETENSVLRKLLNLNTTPGPTKTNAETIPIQKLIESVEFILSRGAVGRFLTILSWIYQRDKTAFSIVENIKGRGRLYFSKSADVLEKSGRSVNPKNIPLSPYWVITTTPTDLKQEMLADVMRALNYDSASINIATAAIER